MEVGQQVGEITSGLGFGEIRPEEAAQAFAGNRLGRSSQVAEERAHFTAPQDERCMVAFKRGRAEEADAQWLPLRFPGDHRQSLAQTPRTPSLAKTRTVR